MQPHDVSLISNIEELIHRGYHGSEAASLFRDAFGHAQFSPRGDAAQYFATAAQRRHPPAGGGTGHPSVRPHKARRRADAGEIGRAHVSTPVNKSNIVCRLLLEKKKTQLHKHEYMSRTSR